jgi:hypothetical protein
MCDLLYLSAVNSALLETASGASNTKWRSDGSVVIWLNNISYTRVFCGFSYFWRTYYHYCCGPYHALLPWWVVVLLMYIHIFLFVCGGLVSTGFVGAVGFDTVVVYGGFNIGIVVVVGSTWGYVLV